MLVVTCNKPLSWYWQGFIILALITALACIVFCVMRHAYPWWLGMLLALWFIYYTYQHMVLLCWRRKPQAIIALHLQSATDIEIIYRNGEHHRATLCPGSLILAPMAILQVKLVNKKARVLLEARHIWTDDYHALARMVHAG